MDWTFGGELTAKDWLFDGSPCTEERMADLDWSMAWLDLGPSLHGNTGPYWHVPHKDKNQGTTHRLYPKILRTKWARLIHEACWQSAQRAYENPEQHKLLEDMLR